MRFQYRSAIVIALLPLCACSYGEEKLPDCWNENVPSSLVTLKRLPPIEDAVTEIQHSLCSTEKDRLGNAERALSAEGYAYKREVAELGECIQVRVHARLTPPTLKRDIERLCTIASASRIAYLHWSGQVDDSFVFVHGDFVTVNKMKPANVR